MGRRCYGNYQNGEAMLVDDHKIRVVKGPTKGTVSVAPLP